MIAYIYHIINKINGKKYIGKTNNLPHRIESHLSALALNKHHSVKLQRAYNKYGKDNFIFSYQEVEVANEDELSLREILEIEKYDSYNNGYNMTLGGDGNQLLLDYSTRILVYQILQRYNGICNTLARYYHCSPDVFYALRDNILYDKLEYSQQELNNLIEKIGLSDSNLKENYVAHNEKKLNEETCLAILSIISHSTGYDKTLCEIFNINSKLTYNLRRELAYKNYINKFKAMSVEEQEALRLQTMEKYDLEHRRSERQRRCVKNPLTQEQVNYIMDTKDTKRRVDVARELGISADRVGSVILGKSYKDLVAKYYSSKN